MPDRWVPTTCGYCSVGCGMFIGVKDGRAVSVRGNPGSPGESRHALSEGSVRAPHHSATTARAIRCCAAATQWSA
jgi:anaerobic selenocysteine-containing dehydrogenase